MNKNTWIIVFFVALAGHIIGERLHNQKTDIIYKGGRGFRINFKKAIDPSQVDEVRNDLTKAFDGERPVIKSISNDSVLDIITAYRINESSREADSVVIARMMKGLKSNLPPDITYEQFDQEYKLGQKMLQPLKHGLDPGLGRTIYPFLYYGCKALLIPLLLIFFLVSAKGISSPLKKWIGGALLFSWIGDVLLMFVSKNEIFFLLGLGSFLTAHIFYIFSFQKITRTEKLRRNIFLDIITAVYTLSLLFFLKPYLGEMKIPVYAYGCILGTMLGGALRLSALKNRPAGFSIVFGASLFVISDSMLALNKFYQPFEAAGILIMLTYGLAQLFIVKGAIRYLNSVDNR